MTARPAVAYTCRVYSCYPVAFRQIDSVSETRQLMISGGFSVSTESIPCKLRFLRTKWRYVMAVIQSEMVGIMAMSLSVTWKRSRSILVAVVSVKGSVPDMDFIPKPQIHIG